MKRNRRSNSGQSRISMRSRNSDNINTSILTDETYEDIPRTEEGWWESLGNEHIVNNSNARQYDSILVQRRQSVRIYSIQDDEDDDSLGSLPDMSSTFVYAKRKSGFFKKPALPTVSKLASETQGRRSPLTEFHNKLKPPEKFSFFPEDKKTPQKQHSIGSDDLSDVSFDEVTNKKREPLFRRTDVQNKSLGDKISYNMDDDSDTSELFDINSPAKPPKLLFSAKPNARKSIFLDALSTSKDQDVQEKIENVMENTSIVDLPENAVNTRKSLRHSRNMNNSLPIKEVNGDETILNTTVNKEVSVKMSQKPKQSENIVDNEELNFSKVKNLSNTAKTSPKFKKGTQEDNEISKFQSQQSQQSTIASQTIDPNMNSPKPRSKNLFKFNKDKLKMRESIFANAISMTDASIASSQTSEDGVINENEVINNFDVPEAQKETPVPKSFFADDLPGDYISFNQLNRSKNTQTSVEHITEQEMNDIEPQKTKRLFNLKKEMHKRKSLFASALSDTEVSEKQSQEEVIPNSQPDNTEIHQKTHVFESSKPMKTKQIFKMNPDKLANKSVFAAALSDTENSISIAQISNLSKHISQNVNNDNEAMDIDPIHAENVKESPFLKAIAEFEMDDQPMSSAVINKKRVSEIPDNTSRSKIKKSGEGIDISQNKDNNSHDASKPLKPKMLFNIKPTTNLRNSVFADALSDSEESLQETHTQEAPSDKHVSKISSSKSRLSMQVKKVSDVETENKIQDKIESSPTSSIASDTSNFDRWRQLASSTMISGDIASPQNKSRNKPRLSRLYHSSKKFEIHSDIMEETESASKNSDANSKIINLESIKETEKINNQSKNSENEKEQSMKLSTSWGVIGNMSNVKEDLPEAVRNAKVFKNSEHISIDNIAINALYPETKMQSPKMKRQSVGTWLRMDEEKSQPLNQSDIDRLVLEEIMAKRTNPPVRRSNEVRNETNNDSEITEKEEVNTPKSRIYPLRHSNVPINTYNVQESPIQEKREKSIMKPDKNTHNVSLPLEQPNNEINTDGNINEAENIIEQEKGTKIDSIVNEEINSFVTNERSRRTSDRLKATSKLDNSIKKSIIISDKTVNNISLHLEQPDDEILTQENVDDNIIQEINTETENVVEKETSKQINLIENEDLQVKDASFSVTNENSRRTSNRIKSNSKLDDSIIKNVELQSNNDSRRISNRLKQNSQFLEVSVNKTENNSIKTGTVDKEQTLDQTNHQKNNVNMQNEIQTISINTTKQNVSSNNINLPVENSEMDTLNIGVSFQKNMEDTRSNNESLKPRRTSSRLSQLPVLNEHSQNVNESINKTKQVEVVSTKEIENNFVEPRPLENNNQSQANEFMESDIGISFQRNMMSSMVNVTETSSAAAKSNLSKQQQSMVINKVEKEITKNKEETVNFEKSKISGEKKLTLVDSPKKLTFTPATITSPNVSRRSNRISKKYIDSPMPSIARVSARESTVKDLTNYTLDESKNPQKIDLEVVKPIPKPINENFNKPMKEISNKRVSYMPPEDTFILRLPTESMDGLSRNSIETTHSNSDIVKNQSNIEKSANEISANFSVSEKNAQIENENNIVEMEDENNTVESETENNTVESETENNTVESETENKTAESEIENNATEMVEQADNLETDPQKQSTEVDEPEIDQSEFENPNQSAQITKERYSIKYHSNMFLDFNAMSTPKQARKSVRISLPGMKIPMLESRMELSKRINATTEPSVGSSIDRSDSKIFQNLTVNNSEKIFHTPGSKRTQPHDEESTSRQINSNTDNGDSNNDYEMSDDYDENHEDDNIPEASANEDSEVTGNKMFSLKNKTINMKKVDQTELNKCLEKLKAQNETAKKKAENFVKNLLTNPTRPVYSFPSAKKPAFKIPVQFLKSSKPATRIKNNSNQKQKLYMKEQWITKRLYKFVQTRLVDRYGVKTDTRSERFVKDLAMVVNLVSKTKTDYYKHVETLRTEMARLNLVVTYRDFHDFVREYLPFTFRLKSIPAIGRDIPFLKCREDEPILQ